MSKKKKKKFEYPIAIPYTPYWIKRADDPRSISIYDLSVAQLRKFGQAFTKNLIERRNKGMSGKFIKSV